jgi:hypothetical protein
MKSSKKKCSRQPEKRRQNQLERDTAAYYENMTEEELKAERELEDALADAAKGIDFDNEM